MRSYFRSRYRPLVDCTFIGVHLREYSPPVSVKPQVNLLFRQGFIGAYSSTLHQEFKLLGTCLYAVIVPNVSATRPEPHFKIGAGKPTQALWRFVFKISHTLE